jgi:NADPH2:quinone reductase
VLLDDHAWLSVWAKTRRGPSAPTVVTHWLPLHQHLANTTDTAGSRGGARLLTVRAVQPHEGAVEVAASIGLRAESIGGQVRRDVEQAVDPAEGLDRGRDKPGAGVVVGDIEPPPFVPGGEVVGTRCDTGERVAALCRTGGHAQYVAVPRELLFAIPDGVDDPTALSVFVPGLTAALLVNAARPSETDRVAVLGATGAVGSLLLGLLVERGVRTRVVSVRDQAARAEAAGLGATGFAYPGSGTLTEDLNTAAGGPLDIVFDAVGGTATEAAVSALGRFGRLFCYGSAGGEPAVLGARSLVLGSRSVTGFWLLDHVSDADSARRELGLVFDAVVAKRLVVRAPELRGLADLRAAVEAASERGRRGRVLIDPWANVPRHTESPVTRSLSEGRTA